MEKMDVDDDTVVDLSVNDRASSLATRVARSTLGSSPYFQSMTGTSERGSWMGGSLEVTNVGHQDSSRHPDVGQYHQSEGEDQAMRSLSPVPGQCNYNPGRFVEPPPYTRTDSPFPDYHSSAVNLKRSRSLDQAPSEQNASNYQGISPLKEMLSRDSQPTESSSRRIHNDASHKRLQLSSSTILSRRDREVPPAAGTPRNDAPQDLSRANRPLEEISTVGDAVPRALIPRTMKEFDDRYPRRNLRPRPERSYAESPDIIVLSDEEPRLNGFATNGYDSDTDEGEMPPLPPIKELSPAELAERERGLRKLREELRNEEMKLVLLKKLRQSQQMKENIAVVPPSQQPSSKVPPPGKVLPPPQQTPPPPLMRSHPSNKQGSPNVIPPLLRGQPQPSRGQSLHHPPPLMMAPGRGSTTGLPPNMMPLQRGSGGTLGRPPLNTPPNMVVGYNVGSQDRGAPKESHHSPAPTPISQTQQQQQQQQILGTVENKPPMGSGPLQLPDQDRVRVEETQTPAQRQAAAKLALRKQLEKTLLQIPPPKPPPPEMHFIPNPSNTEFIYLLGLEHVVDFITKDQKTPPPPDAFKCSQCHTDFTPVWKWEKNPSKGKEPKVICEQCVTTNVKKALKAEHTNRLKTAFVKALQQEQEIEQRLAQVSCASPQPAPPSVPEPPAPSPVIMSAPATPKPATPTLPPRHAPTPPAPAPPPAPTPPLPHRDHPLAKLAADATKFSSHHAAAAAALHQQLLRGMPQHQPMPAHMIPFSPLLYPYQLAMAQATSGKGSVAAAAANLVELQRQAADLQRQYLLDMIPSPQPSPSRSHPHSLNNWKT